jgi:hypothetical protein
MLIPDPHTVKKQRRSHLEYVDDEAVVAARVVGERFRGKHVVRPVGSGAQLLILLLSRHVQLFVHLRIFIHSFILT